MIRASSIERSLEFYCGVLGFSVLQRVEAEKFHLTYVVLAAAGDLPEAGEGSRPTLELIHNWDEGALPAGRNFGHLAYEVENIYETCSRLKEHGVELLRAPHDGHKAFALAPDSIVLELLQRGERLPLAEPWISMKRTDEIRRELNYAVPFRK